MRPPSTPDGHYPQQQSAPAGSSDMVTPRRVSTRKKFWEVNGEDSEEVEHETLVHRPADAPDHAPSEHGSSDEVAWDFASDGLSVWGVECVILHLNCNLAELAKRAGSRQRTCRQPRGARVESCRHVLQ